MELTTIVLSFFQRICATRSLCSALFVALLLGPVAVATADGSRQLAASERKEILERISVELQGGYLYEDKGNAFASQISRAAAEDRFSEAQTAGDFAKAVTEFLFEISNDRHLRLGLAPEQPESRRPSDRTTTRARPGSGAHGGASGDNDYGVREARVLDGNIGYLDLRGFAGSSAAQASIDAAMLKLAQTEALIIDLGRNGGGGPWMVRYLSGFLFAESTHLTDTWMRGMESPRERWTLDGQDTDAFVDKPVYILTSGRTFSAAESFTFGLLINDRVTLVGERTGGGGHFGGTVEVAPDLRLFVPTGRTYDPDTGKGWEAEGLEPHIEVPYAESLQRAIETIRSTSEPAKTS